jgi:hypothetical protein
MNRTATKTNTVIDPVCGMSVNPKTTEIVANTMQMLGSAGDQVRSGGSDLGPPPNDTISNINTEDDIPF